MKRTIPAISIIIPMYNAEKYVGECLDSILAQTFDDYEVIVVDDCSTDNSASIVESYIPKFNKNGIDRLQLIRSKTNSGGASTPRNIGLRISVGDYIFFMDSDDAIVENTLERLYGIAEDFQSDVVHCNKCFIAPDETVTTDRSLLKISTPPQAEPVTNPALISNSLAKRVEDLALHKMRWEPWSHLTRRDFLMNNDIHYLNLCVADDMLFSIFLILLADKIVVSPDAFYVWRTISNSNSREILSPEKCIHRRGGDVLRAIGILDKLMARIEFFKEHPQHKYILFDLFARGGGLLPVLELYTKFPAYQLDDIVRREISEIHDTTALTAFLFARMNIFNVNILQYQRLIQNQQQQIQQLQAQVQQLQQSQSQKFHLNADDIFK